MAFGGPVVVPMLFHMLQRYTMKDKGKQLWHKGILVGGFMRVWENARRVVQVEIGLKIHREINFINFRKLPCLDHRSDCLASSTLNSQPPNP